MENNGPYMWIDFERRRIVRLHLASQHRVGPFQLVVAAHNPVESSDPF
jgi:hypothetical protein